ncbi:MAG TPA: hypothetical protein VMS30_04700 [Phycisphaerales bacterium]|nr:hypothetical protein [Phycisphaerales bacterium]
MSADVRLNLDLIATPPSWRLRGLFLALACAIAITFWLCADWWVYFDIGGRSQRKFIMPLWFQIAVSLSVGIVGSGLITIIIQTHARMKRWRRWRGRQCLECGYPIGESDVCTECGAAVQVQADVERA